MKSENSAGGAHPRSRGENNCDVLCPRRERGSSPLTRGKHCRPFRHCRYSGLIPAHAGKTRRPGPDPGRPRAHPRSRGENRHCVGSRTRREGSSPLTRGKLSSRSRAKPVRGLIPAHAGKTTAASPGRQASPAHPRSRGENVLVTQPVLQHRGSSPLTRGKHGHRNEQIPVPGLIPAHAGKTAPRALNRAGRRAHPRSRGENHMSRSATRACLGSSPLTRGKREEQDGDCWTRGLIPAHAGKTLTATVSLFGAWAHPRSRGENLDDAIANYRLAGSSPLTRGKQCS